jgi:uncharacterized membrane protein YqiK
MDKKAQGMSLNIVVIAVIVLIILVVLVLVFSGKLKFFGSKTTETTSQYTGAKCQIPGTNNDCSDQTECNRKGGSYVEDYEKYDDCGGYCCMM